jgi:DNA-binding cell septation regulator SpoVG
VDLRVLTCEGQRLTGIISGSLVGFDDIFMANDIVIIAIRSGTKISSPSQEWYKNQFSKSIFKAI